MLDVFWSSLVYAFALCRCNQSWQLFVQCTDSWLRSRPVQCFTSVATAQNHNDQGASACPCHVQSSHLSVDIHIPSTAQLHHFLSVDHNTTKHKKSHRSYACARLKARAQRQGACELQAGGFHKPHTSFLGSQGIECFSPRGVVSHFCIPVFLHMCTAGQQADRHLHEHTHHRTSGSQLT